MELKELLDKCINDRLIDLTISGQKVKNEEDVMRVKIRPVQLKDEIKYQASEFVGRKVLHTNYSEEEIKTRITVYMENTFKQAQFNIQMRLPRCLVQRRAHVPVSIKGLHR